MKLVETHKYRFPSYLLPALINNEPVDEAEDKYYLEKFLSKLEKHKKEYGASHYTIDYESDSYFSHTNSLYAVGCNVTDIKILFLR
jgi:hypothetical protein